MISTAGQWGQPQPITEDPVLDPRLGIDDAGRPMVMWRVKNGSRYDLRASRRAGTAWPAPDTVASGLVVWGSGDLAVDGSGNAVAVWHADGAAMRRRFTPGAGWKPAESLTSDVVTTRVRVVAGPRGHVAAWWAVAGAKSGEHAISGAVLR